VVERLGDWPVIRFRFLPRVSAAGFTRWYVVGLALVRLDPDLTTFLVDRRGVVVPMRGIAMTRHEVVMPIRIGRILVFGTIAILLASSLAHAQNVAAGSLHTVAAKPDGTVWAWGYNGYGNVGDGTTTTRYSPVQVSTLSGVRMVAAGAHHSLALKNDGTVWAWGNNTSGQLGDGMKCTGFVGGPIRREDVAHGTTEQVLPGAA
jgi:hypothetical protein